jgi:hypothetical protein
MILHVMVRHFMILHVMFGCRVAGHLTRATVMVGRRVLRILPFRHVARVATATASRFTRVIFGIVLHVYVARIATAVFR